MRNLNLKMANNSGWLEGIIPFQKFKKGPKLGGGVISNWELSPSFEDSPMHILQIISQIQCLALYMQPTSAFSRIFSETKAPPPLPP